MQKLTEGKGQIEVEGHTVRQVIEALDLLYPGMKDRLVADNRIKMGLSVAIDGEITTEGLRAKVGTKSEVHFLPALAGG